MNGNNIQLIDDCNTELTNIKLYINKNPLDSMVKYLVSYSVIRSCGTVEIVYKDIIYNHLIQNANKEAISYFSKNIKDSSSNPKTGRISSLLEQINPKWKTSFENNLKDTVDKEHLNSLVTLRNQVAHGSSITASIDNIIKYFDSGCNILNILDSIVTAEIDK